MLVLRPSPAAPAARAQLIAATAFGIVIVTGLAVLSLVAASPVGFALALVCVGWYGGLPLLYFRNATLFVDDTEMGKSDLLGRRTAVPRERVAGVRVARTGARTHKLLIEDVGGRVLISAYTTAWTPDHVRRLRAALGID